MCLEFLRFVHINEAISLVGDEDKLKQVLDHLELPRRYNFEHQSVTRAMTGDIFSMTNKRIDMDTR